LSELERELAREKAEKAETLKNGASKTSELSAQVKGLESRLAQERKAREQAANRVAALIKELEEAKVE